MTDKYPLGMRRHNPGNIEYKSGVLWQGQVEPHDGQRFAAFEKPEWGIRAIARVLVTYEDKRKTPDGSPIDTVAEFIGRWAPASENDTESYAGHMRDLLDVKPGDTITVHDYETCKTLVTGIITHENGFCPYDDTTIARGLMLAGMEPPETVYSLFKPQPKPMHQSRTATGGATAAVGAGGFGLMSVLEWIWGKLADGNAIQLIFVAAVIIGVGVMVYGYWRARQEGRVDADAVGAL